MDKARLNPLLTVIAGICAALFFYAASSHADQAITRYVSGHGNDSSDCSNAFRPCRSLSYALAQIHKNDPIHVGEGEYQIVDLNNLYALLNTDLKAGMDRLSHYSSQSPEVVSTLTNVPVEYRDVFSQMGFHVIVDGKGKAISKSSLKSFNQKMQASRSNHAQTACVSGMAAGFPCENIDLLAHLNLDTLKTGATSGSDIWGFVDLNTQREYIIMGVSNGVAVVDVSDPENPYIVGTQDGLRSTWRDIKIYQSWNSTLSRWQAWAYVATEANMGLAIIDLSDLPNRISSVNYVSDFATAHNVYLTNVDYIFGVAHENAVPLLTVAGSNLSGGQFRLYSLLPEPSNPQLISPLRNASFIYMHDAASVQISDARKSTQCVNASQAATCKLLADFNETEFVVWDVTVPDQPRQLSSTSYNFASYVHSGWWSEDGRYLFVHDEFDERNRGLNTTLRAFDMNDLSAPQLLTVWTGPTTAIDHNGFVRGNRYYMSNYVEGLSVLDITDPDNSQLVATFDTEPTSTSPVFEGAWGIYPFLPSDTLAVSDSNSGLFLLKDKSLESINGSFAFSQGSWGAAEGQTLSIDVARLDDSQGAVDVTVVAELLSASSSDITLATNNLSWADGDSSPKSLSLDLLNDGISEGDELLVLRLESPNGGATLKQPNIAYVQISDGVSPSALAPVKSTIVVNHSQDKIFASVRRQGEPQGTVSVDWQLENTSSIALDQSSGTLTWNDGEFQPLTIELAYTAKPDTSESFVLRLSNPVNTNLVSDSFTIQKLASIPSSGGSTTSSSSGGSTGGSAGNGNSGGGSGGPFLIVLVAAFTLLKRRLHKQNPG